MHKVTILPRGRALGYTMVLPDEDKYSQTRSELLDKLAYMMGGRAAEEMVFHDPTTGAGNDIEKATNLARAMVTQYGMTERLGAIRLGEANSEPFLGRDIGHARNYSEDVAAKVDEETKLLLAGAHQEAFDILEENRDVLDDLVLRAARQGDPGQGRGRADLRAAAAALRRDPRGPARRTATRRRSLRSRSRRRSATGSTDQRRTRRRGGRGWRRDHSARRRWRRPRRPGPRRPVPRRSPPAPND